MGQAVKGLMLTLMILLFTIFSLVHVSMVQLYAAYAIDRAKGTLPTWFQSGSECLHLNHAFKVPILKHPLLYSILDPCLSCTFTSQHLVLRSVLRVVRFSCSGF